MNLNTSRQQYTIPLGTPFPGKCPGRYCLTFVLKLPSNWNMRAFLFKFKTKFMPTIFITLPRFILGPKHNYLSTQYEYFTDTL